MEKQINFKKKSFWVKYPNVGQFIDIEFRKMALTNNMYAELVKSFNTAALTSTYNILDVVDAFATITVLIPEINRVLVDEKGESYSYDTMPIDLTIELVKLYKEHLLPWITDINKKFQELSDKSQAKQKSKQKKDEDEFDEKEIENEEDKEGE